MQNLLGVFDLAEPERSARLREGEDGCFRQESRRNWKLHTRPNLPEAVEKRVSGKRPTRRISREEPRRR